MSRRHIAPNDHELRQLAYRLRNNPRPAEQRLWTRLRHEQIRDYRFYHQQPIDGYLTDFYCPALDLVVEVDGHGASGIERQAQLEALGAEVVRFSARAVMKDVEQVVRRIEEVVEALEEEQADDTSGCALLCSSPVPEELLSNDEWPERDKKPEVRTREVQP